MRRKRFLLYTIESNPESNYLSIFVVWETHWITSVKNIQLHSSLYFFQQYSITNNKTPSLIVNQHVTIGISSEVLPISENLQRIVCHSCSCTGETCAAVIECPSDDSMKTTKNNSCVAIYCCTLFVDMSLIHSFMLYFYSVFIAVCGYVLSASRSYTACKIENMNLLDFFRRVMYFFPRFTAFNVLQPVKALFWVI